MLMWLCGVVVAAAAVGAAVASPALLNNHLPLVGHQVWEVEGGEATATVERLSLEGLVDPLGRRGESHSVRVAPGDMEEVAAALGAAGLSYTTTVFDLASLVKSEGRRMRYRRSELRQTQQQCTAASCPSPFTDAYMTFEEVEHYLRHISADPRVKLRSLGTTDQGRDIWLAEITPAADSGCKNESVNCNRTIKHVWIEGGIHAREWIAPAVALALIDRILAADLTSPAALAHHYIVPVANPDGYVFTWTKNRMWRKNRAKTSNTDCLGVDLNRNWALHWGVGASQNPCSNVYKGTRPFSEPETRALSGEMMRVDQKVQLDLVLSLHSYSQLLLYPSGWTIDPAPNTPDMIRVGKVFAEAAAGAFGTQYGVVNAAGGLYYASGATEDWAKEQLNTTYVYTLELRDQGKDGFILPSEEIAPVAQEVWQGYNALLAAIN